MLNLFHKVKIDLCLFRTQKQKLKQKNTKIKAITTPPLVIIIDNVFDLSQKNLKEEIIRYIFNILSYSLFYIGIQLHTCKYLFIAVYLHYIYNIQ